MFPSPIKRIRAKMGLIKLERGGENNKIFFLSVSIFDYEDIYCNVL